MNIIVEPLCYLINAFLYEGKYPNHLKRAFVIPILKRGDSEKPKKYRPISITSALSKNLEKIIEQITTCLSEKSLLNPLQFGFRKNFRNRCSFVCDRNYKEKCRGKWKCGCSVPRFIEKVWFNFTQNPSEEHWKILTLMKKLKPWWKFTSQKDIRKKFCLPMIRKGSNCIKVFQRVPSLGLFCLILTSMICNTLFLRNVH